MKQLVSFVVAEPWERRPSRWRAHDTFLAAETAALPGPSRCVRRILHNVIGWIRGPIGSSPSNEGQPCRPRPWLVQKGACCVTFLRFEPDQKLLALGPPGGAPGGPLVGFDGGGTGFVKGLGAGWATAGASAEVRRPKKPAIIWTTT
jgi:hypothetical protein